jgi:hypothetical protein
MDAQLDCYQGAYGLTIRFDSNSLDPLYTLRDTFKRLAMGETSDIALHRLDGLAVSNLEELTLGVVDAEPEVSLRRLRRGTFRWVNTKKGWQRCCGLIDGLITFKKPSHQYLTNEDVDDALVEVCLYERADGNRKKDGRA